MTLRTDEGAPVAADDQAVRDDRLPAPDGDATFDVEVDARGKPCPQPVIELAKAVRGAELGAVVRLRADDPAAKVDIPVWCRMQRQRLVSQTPDADDGWVFEVEKVRELG